MWKKNQGQMIFLKASESPPLDMREWSAVLFWNGDGRTPEHNSVERFPNPEIRLPDPLGDGPQPDDKPSPPGGWPYDSPGYGPVPGYPSTGPSGPGYNIPDVSMQIPTVQQPGLMQHPQGWPSLDPGGMIGLYNPHPPGPPGPPPQGGAVLLPTQTAPILVHVPTPPGLINPVIQPISQIPTSIPGLLPQTYPYPFTYVPAVPQPSQIQPGNTYQDPDRPMPSRPQVMSRGTRPAQQITPNVLPSKRSEDDSRQYPGVDPDGPLTSNAGVKKMRGDTTQPSSSSNAMPEDTHDQPSSSSGPSVPVHDLTSGNPDVIDVDALPGFEIPTYDLTDTNDDVIHLDYCEDKDIYLIDPESDCGQWKYMDESQKCYANCASFSRPTNIIGEALKEVNSCMHLMECRYDIDPSPVFQSRTRADIVEDMSGITDEDRTLFIKSLRALGHGYKATPKSRSAAMRKRKEATSTELRKYRDQFSEAKHAEVKSWIGNEVYDIIDMRKMKVKNFVTGRWVLVVKNDKDGNFSKCKARWVLRGFQDKQKDDLQTDSPTASRPGLRLALQYAANCGHTLRHIDLKTAFLQGQAFDKDRDVVCQLPPEAGYPNYMGARMKKCGYGLNDAPRKWWNKIDSALLSYGLVPTRADRCCYVLYGANKYNPDQMKTHMSKGEGSSPDVAKTIDTALEYLTDPVCGSPAAGKVTSGVLCLHVDDLIMAGDEEFQERVVKCLKTHFEVGSEDIDDIEFCGQRIKWIAATPTCGAHISVSQSKSIDALEQTNFDASLKDDTPCNPTMHTMFRSVLGQINWLQSRTQFQACYGFSRCASASAAPTIKDVRELNKLVRMIKSCPVVLKHFPLKGTLRLVGYPDASYRNNSDKSSQRGLIVCLAEQRTSSSTSTERGSAPPNSDTIEDKFSARGCVVAFESHKIKRTTLSTTVAELYAFMKVYGSTQFLRGLWMDISSQVVDIHMRTDANNLVTTAGTTHLPEQQETIHMIQMLRKESSSGSIKDLAHVRTLYMLADCLTKNSAKPDVLIRAVDQGILPNVDLSPPFREMIKHKAYCTALLSRMYDSKKHDNRPFSQVSSFFTEDISDMVHAYCANSAYFQEILRDGPVDTDPSETADAHAHARAYMHSHVCNSCERPFVHFHAGEKFHRHSVEDYNCCYTGCSSYFGLCTSFDTNPYHARPSD